MYYSTVLGNKVAYYSEYHELEMLDFLGNTFNILDDFDADLLEMEEGYESRPDLVSDTAYMDEMHIDLICKLNGISNPHELNDDGVLALPTGEFLYSFAQAPSEKWKEERETQAINRPQPVTKSEKRKPNQAVIGDSRFTIDKNSKIVIY